jgi:hypothetical protein
MEGEQILPDNLQDAVRRGVLKRLPLTFLPFVNQQLQQWAYLFPNERQSVERLLLMVADLTPAQSAALFQDVVALEEKMGVRHWDFSTREQTIQNASLLARSAWFQEWRRAVQVVFDAADRDALTSSAHSPQAAHRLILLDFPESLPVQAQRCWSRWQDLGRVLQLDPGASNTPGSAFERLLAGNRGLLNAAQGRPAASHTDVWVIDAGDGLVQPFRAQQPSIPAAGFIQLCYRNFDLYRQNFSREMNAMRKDLADADAVYDTLRKVNVTPWCSPELAVDPLIREFVRSVFLSGNGAVIFPNSFVEWAASEAFRRARPSFVAARFGVRSMPKPFTAVAVFENPDEVNPLPPVDDLEGSALDAEVLAHYIWLAAARFHEYRSSTVCVCLAERLNQAWLVAPGDFPLAAEPQAVPIDRLHDALLAWIA